MYCAKIRVVRERFFVKSTNYVSSIIEPISDDPFCVYKERHIVFVGGIFGVCSISIPCIERERKREMEWMKRCRQSEMRQIWDLCYAYVQACVCVCVCRNNPFNGI